MSTAFAPRFVESLWLGLTGYAAQTPEEVVEAQFKVENHIPLAHPLQMFLPWTPTIDGQLVADQPLHLYAQGKFAKVPVMMVCG